jgi:DNA helicase-2/ATP-dependent DNA helicase PcrA
MTDRIWSPAQEAIFAHFAKGQSAGHLTVIARAGTGKSTTMVEGAERSPDRRVMLTAFNKTVADELKERVGFGRISASTLHSLGYRLIKHAYGDVDVRKPTWKRASEATEVAAAMLGMPKPQFTVSRLISKLHSTARTTIPEAQTGPELKALAVQFDMVPDDMSEAEGWTFDAVLGVAAMAMEVCSKPPFPLGIDYDDMLFLPIRNKLMIPAYDLVVVDEAQDMSASQLTLARGIVKPGGRIVLVGDDRQAIYGFRGADSGGLARLTKELGSTVLKLTTTYRCGKAIVAKAKELVPDFEAGPDNHEGKVINLGASVVPAMVEAGDFVLSRTNAPLARMALAILKMGKPVRVMGADKELGARILELAKKLGTGAAGRSIPEFLKRLTRWRTDETKRAQEGEMEERISQIADIGDVLLALSEGASGVPEMQTRLSTLFEGKEDLHFSELVVCSSIHRSKGLEARRVFVLKDSLYPTVNCAICRHRHYTDDVCSRDGCGCEEYEPDPQAQLEEQNLAYVAITRAKEELVWVSGGVK